MGERVPKEPTQLSALTSLRFFAAVSIVWLHSKLYFAWAQGGPDFPFEQGVSFFFVLSGFILMHVYGTPHRRVSYRKFMINRIARLWPLHIFTLLCVIAFVSADLSPGLVADLNTNTNAATQTSDRTGMFGQNYYLIANIFLVQSWIPSHSYAFSWNGVAWSISTEMFFYLLFPPLMLAMRVRPIYALLVGLASLVFVAIVIKLFNIPASGSIFDVTAFSLLYSFPVSRLFEFTLGMTSYWVWSRLKQSTLHGFLNGYKGEALIALLWVIWFGWVFRSIEVAILNTVVLGLWFKQSGSCFLFALTIIVFAGSSGPIGRLLNKPILVKLGEISFAIYMVHQIIMNLFVANAPGWTSPIFVFTSILVLATAAHYFCELPGKKYGTRDAQFSSSNIKCYVRH